VESLALFERDCPAPQTDSRAAAAGQQA